MKINKFHLTMLLTFPAWLFNLANGSNNTITDGRNKAEIVVKLEKESPGRVFEGIGTLSAGASSALLMDYPEPASNT
jgi:hypothetical protein